MTGGKLFVAAAATQPASASYTATAAAFSVMGPGQASERYKMPSRITYRFMLWDLTASGLTFTRLATIDQQMYVDQVLTPGGRYYGRTTPTAPSALP